VGDVKQGDVRRDVAVGQILVGELMSWKALLVVGGLAVAVAYFFVSPSTLLAFVPPFLR
jgi:hypothetical protein